MVISVKCRIMHRFYEDILLERLQEERQMLFLMGPRQVGKTTTSRQVGEERETSLYLNWDNLDHRESLLQMPSRLARDLGLDHLQGTRPLLVLDEIHKYPGWRTLLKGFFDTYGTEADILVTGSAHLSVFNFGGDSLMGRYFGYRMHPLSVAELALPENAEPPGKRPPGRLDESTYEALLEFGGFPEPLLRQDRRFSNRWQRLRNHLLFREDLRDLTRIQEVAKVQTLAELVNQGVGQGTNYSRLARGINASVDSVQRWLNTLESLYFCFAVRPWFKNIRRALRKEPRFYLWDWSLVRDPGARFENLLACALLKACHYWTDEGYGEFGLHFLRDKQKREVDFLVSRDGEAWLLVEAKVSGQRQLSPSLACFRDQLGAPLALQVAGDLPFVDRDCFALERPTIVPARTFLSQLV